MAQSNAQANIETEDNTTIINCVYEDSQTSRLKRVIYHDEFVVVLRSEAGVGDVDVSESQYSHELLTVSEFRDKQESNELTYREDTFEVIPKTNLMSAGSSVVEEINSHVNGSVTDVDGNPVNTGGGNGGEQIGNGSGEEQFSEDEQSPQVDERWRGVLLVGEKIEMRLHKQGIASRADIRTTAKPELCEIDGVSGQTADNLKEYALGTEGIEQWSDVKFVGDVVERRLYEHGFEKKVDIRNSTVGELRNIGHVGRETIKTLFAYADTEQLRVNVNNAFRDDNKNVDEDVDSHEVWGEDETSQLSIAEAMGLSVDSCSADQ